MPAKRQSIRIPEIRNHYKENTNKKSVSRGRVGGVGCFAVSQSTISLDSIATQQEGQEGIYYLNANLKDFIVKVVVRISISKISL